MRVFIDVREREEFSDSHVDGAVHVPLTMLATGLYPDHINISDELIVYCRSGHRAGVALQIFQQLGFHHVINGINQDHVEAHHI